MLSKILLVFGLAIIGSATAVDWAKSCRSPQMVPMDAALKKALLDIHNKDRNEIALGKIEHYDQAANMATLQWDDKLAANADKNVHQCEMKHDSTGQNLAMGFELDTPQKIADLAKLWFNEYKKGKMDNIKKFSGGQGHFTQMVWAKANKVGCAVSKAKKNQGGKDWNGYWLACNYSSGNLIGAEVYVSGKAASKCKTGKNKDYPGLCSPTEKYE